MISIVDETMVAFKGLSTDTKPADATNGSSFLEMDTGDMYYWDADSEAWIKAS